MDPPRTRAFGWSLATATAAAAGSSHTDFTTKGGATYLTIFSERLGHANIAFTIQTYQHVLPGMQAEAARVYEQLARPVPPAADDPVEGRRNGRRNTA